MLAQTGDTSGFSIISTQSNDLPNCPNIGYRTVVPSGLSDQQLAADLLAYYFNVKANHGCGETDVDGYLSPADADPNGPNAGVADAGDVLDYTDPSKSNPTSLHVDLPDGTSFNIG